MKILAKSSGCTWWQIIGTDVQRWSQMFKDDEPQKHWRSKTGQIECDSCMSLRPTVATLWCYRQMYVSWNGTNLAETTRCLHNCGHNKCVAGEKYWKARTDARLPCKSQNLSWHLNLGQTEIHDGCDFSLWPLGHCWRFKILCGGCQAAAWQMCSQSNCSLVVKPSLEKRN